MHLQKSGKWVVICIFTIISLWCGTFFWRYIDLSTADLGRHIKNGEIILRDGLSSPLLHTNYYSYTNPNFPFVNHHYGTGLIFYAIWKWFDFEGLSIFYAFLAVSTFLVYLYLAYKMSNIWISATVAIVILPLFTTRHEVRPEMFTYLFSGIFFSILWGYHGKKIPGKWLYLLPFILLLWANLHIGFFMGWMLVGIFLSCSTFSVLLDGIKKRLTIRQILASTISDEKNIFLTVLLDLCLLTSLINSNGFSGAIYPLQIFCEYGYLIVENQSVYFLEKLNHTEGMHFLLLKIMVAVIALSFIVVWMKNRKKFSMPLFVIACVTGVMAYFGIRNFPFFALFGMTILSHNIVSIGKIRNDKYLIKPKYLYFIIAIVIMVCLYRDYNSFYDRLEAYGTGLYPGNNLASDFVRLNHIDGPIFNNYDIGGYLIFGLDNAKVFIDNRPEAYPTDFIQNEYILAQTNEDEWRKLSAKYHFSSIVFSHRDFTPWGQEFLVKRIQDKAWACVFVDRFNIVFVKRTKENMDMISKYEVPRSQFEIN